MKKFALLAYGFVPPTQEIMDAWNSWFSSIGDRLVEAVGPFGPGREITHTGITELPVDLAALTGYCIVRADSMDEAVEIAKDCPIITSLRVYEVKSM